MAVTELKLEVEDTEEGRWVSGQVGRQMGGKEGRKEGISIQSS